jgi:hypothetical protein
MLVNEVLQEAVWVDHVKEKWHSPPGFFDKPATEIAKGLKAASRNLLQAMARLNFYVNRAGSNLEDKDHERLDQAKSELEKLYADEKDN